MIQLNNVMQHRKNQKGHVLDIKFSSFGATHTGLQRETNEDYFIAEPKMGLFGVFDGMGGHNAGEVASRSAAEAFRDLVDFHIQRGSANADSGETLIGLAVQSANKSVQLRASGSAALSGMGTTATVVLIQGHLATFAHVGDSRAYLVRGGKILQLTEDHTLAADMIREGHKFDNEKAYQNFSRCLTKVVGSGKPCEPDIFTLDLLDDDRLILCSDGVTRYFDDEPEIICCSRQSDEELASRLIDQANAQGGADNSTVVVVSIQTALNSA